MHGIPSLKTNVVFRTPSWSRSDGSPTSASSPVVRWSTRNDIFRRFSDDATEDDVQVTETTFAKAETAYKKAVRSLESYLNKEDAAAVIPKAKDGNEIDAKEELHQVVRAIQKTKETELDDGKTKKLIKCLDHYQGVFDILSQAEFSGLPLIWGGLKFILLVTLLGFDSRRWANNLQVTKNNNDVLPKVIDVMIDIGRNLERIRGYAALYPTPRMLEFTAELYAAIVEFLEKVIKDAKNAEKNILSKGHCIRPDERLLTKD
ncbi:NACHT domain protein [Colletotrichum tofieldiae]|nr:NACHT domain protein [Colletotrichum tofieldiae]GKT96134.1 NACHT domain protein [Colletotrichum tofieldiae]